MCIRILRNPGKIIIQAQFECQRSCSSFLWIPPLSRALLTVTWICHGSAPRSTSLASSASTGDSLSEEELAQILEQVEEKKKLISTMRNKPWPMAKKLRELRWVGCGQCFSWLLRRLVFCREGVCHPLLSHGGTDQERSDLLASPL